MQVLPAGERPDPKLMDWLSRPDADQDERACLRAPEHCALWSVDLNGDGKRDAVLLWEQGGMAQATLYALGSEGWRRQGQWGYMPGQSLAQWREAIAAGQVRTVPPAWPDLMFGKQLLRLR